MGRLRWLVSGTVALLAVTAARGQVEGDAAARQIRQVQERAQVALALSPDQEVLLRDLRDRLQEELRAIRERVRDGELSAFEGRTQLREALRAQRQARDGILTPDQKALLARARRHVRRLQTAVPRPPKPEELQTNLVEALQLTPAQLLLWEDLIARLRIELAALRQLGEAPSAVEVQRLRRLHREGFEALLTPPQRDDLRRLRERWAESQQPEYPEYDLGWGTDEEAVPGVELWDEPRPPAD